MVKSRYYNTGPVAMALFIIFTLFSLFADADDHLNDGLGFESTQIVHGCYATIANSKAK